MAILSVDEVFEGRSGKMDRMWARAYSRTWRVITDSPYDGAMAVRNAIPVGIGAAYVVRDAGGSTILEQDLQSFALEVAAAVEGTADDGCSWLVTVQYGPYDANTFPANPIDHPLKISWGFAKYEKVVDETIPDPVTTKTKAIVNSAGDYFDPPPTMDDSRPVLRIVRNEQTYSPTLALSWKDTINTDVWNGFAARTVKCGEIPAELRWNQECGYYYEVTYEFEINPSGWKKEVLDQGLRKLVSGAQQAITDSKGQPVTSPVLLDGSGAPLASGADPVFLQFSIYNEAAFSGLNLTLSGAPGQ